MLLVLRKIWRDFENLLKILKVFKKISKVLENL